MTKGPYRWSNLRLSERNEKELCFSGPTTHSSIELFHSQKHQGSSHFTLYLRLFARLFLSALFFFV